MRKWAPLAALVLLCGFAAMAKLRLGQQPDGSFLVSSGQRIDLLGRTVRIEGSRPKDMALSPDKSLVAILAHTEILVADTMGEIKATLKSSAGPLGIAWSPDGKTIYAALGNGKIGCFGWDGSTLTKGQEFAVEPATAKGNPGTGGLAVGSDGTIFAALSIRNRVVALNAQGKIYQTWDVGACPYNLAISADGRMVAVANRGGTVVAPSPEQRDPDTGRPMATSNIASASSAGTLVQVDPRTDVSLVGTITLIDMKRPSLEPRTVMVGRQPSGMSYSADGLTLYAADSDEDAISVIDVGDGSERARVSITPKEDPNFGQIPTAVVPSPDGKRLYVTLGGANAIAVLDNGPKPKVLGYFPTAWYPISVQAVADKVLVACSKGVGSRPAGKTTEFYVHDNVGAYQSFALNDFQNLGAMTKMVARNNEWTRTQAPRKGRQAVPVPERIGEPSVFTHVVYIIKENMSYDTQMGDMTEGNGDPSLCVFPENVTPNQHALARRFGLLDNFYISGTNSADGHQWVDSSIANGYTEQNYGANERSYPFDGGDPLAFSPAGFLWTQARAAGKSVRDFGEFVDRPSIIDTRTGKGTDWRHCWDDYKSGKGQIEVKAFTSETGLRQDLDPVFIGFPLTESDQWRASRFLSQFQQWEQNDSMPNLTIMLLPNDHTGGTSPGWPTPRADVADNDLALGRIVEAISHSKFWPNTLILVAEDDSQNGHDHVDGHRSVAFCISAYSHPHATIDDLYTHVSIATTIGHVLGMQPMTRFDRTAKPMFSCFADKPDLTPFDVVPNQIPVDEVNPPARKAGGKVAQQLAEECAKMNWSEPDIQDQDVVNRAIWQAEAKRSVGRAGYSTQYPTRFKTVKDADDR